MSNILPLVVYYVVKAGIFNLGKLDIGDHFIIWGEFRFIIFVYVISKVVGTSSSKIWTPWLTYLLFLLFAMTR